MAAVGAGIWFPGVERFFTSLSRLITKTGRLITSARQQSNTAATQSDCSGWKNTIRRLEEYQRTLSVLTRRSEETFAQEACLIDRLTPTSGHLERSLSTMPLRGNRRRIQKGS